MTSWLEDLSSITDILWGESTDQRWYPHKWQVMRRLYDFLAVSLVVVTLIWRHCNIHNRIMLFTEMNTCISMDHSRYGLRGWETKLQYNVGWAHYPLHWGHNGRGSVSIHQPHDYLLNRLFRRRSKKTSTIRITGLCVGNSPGAGEFPTQMASNAENVSIWWRHHDNDPWLVIYHCQQPHIAIGHWTLHWHFIWV